MIHIKRDTHTRSKVMNIVIFAATLLFAFSIGLTADDSTETQPVPTLTLAEIRLKSQEIEALGKRLAKENKSEKLEVLVQKATDFIRLFPKSERVDAVYYYLGNSLVRLDRVEEGITVFEELYKELPEARYAGRILLELGLAYDKLSQHEKADAAFKKLIEHKKFGSRSNAKIAKKILEQEHSERKGLLPKTEEIILHDLVGKPIPDFTVKGLDGKEISMKKLKGQVVLIDFWATWCSPCIKEMPKIKKTYAKFKDQKFTIIGISYDRSIDPLKAYIAKEKLPWKQYWDQDRTVRQLFGVKFIPTAVIIDGKGIVRKAKVGGFDLEDAVETYVKENLAKKKTGSTTDENQESE